MNLRALPVETFYHNTNKEGMEVNMVYISPAHQAQNVLIRTNGFTRWLTSHLVWEILLKTILLFQDIVLNDTECYNSQVKLFSYIDQNLNTNMEEG